MATLHYDIELGGGYDAIGPKTLNASNDQKGGLVGDVLQRMLYVGPDGECDPRMQPSPAAARSSRPVELDRMREMFARQGMVDSRLNTRTIQAVAPRRPIQEAVREVVSGPRSNALMKDPICFAGGHGVVKGRTSCACLGLSSSAPSARYQTEWSRMHDETDHHRDDKGRIASEFWSMPNATSLALSMVQAKVLRPPPQRLPILVGRTAPCACSVLGPDLVQLVARAMEAEMRHTKTTSLLDRYANMGETLERLNRRAVDLVRNELLARARSDGVYQHLHNMATGQTPSTRTYDPIESRPVRNGRVEVMAQDFGVDRAKREHASRIINQFKREGLDESIAKFYTDAIHR